MVGGGFAGRSNRPIFWPVPWTRSIVGFGFVICLGLLCFATSITGNDEDSIKPPFDIYGPGLEPHLYRLPTHYFFIVPRRNEKIDVTDFEFSIKSKGGRCPVRKDFLLTDDGILISRYRLLESCDDIILSVTHRGKHLEGSPYEISGPVYSEECDCPVEDMQAWLEAMGCQDSYPQMDKDLDPFPKVNLTWALEKIIEKFKHPGAQSFCHYVLKDNKVYRKCYGEHVGFHIFSDDILMSLKRKVHLPDMEFVMNLGDWPLVGHSWSSLVPIFSWCGSKDSSDIVLPTYDLTEASLHMLERVTLDMLSVQAKNHVPWHEKIPKAFWRGRDSRKERLDLVRLSQQHWDLLEANLTRMFFFRELEEEFSPFASHVSFFDFFNYKYQVSLDGTVAAYRLPYLLAGNSLLLKQDSDYYEFFYQELQPWIHYVPFKSDLSDLLEKILWAKDHEDEVQRIISRARAFAREHLLPHHILCYHAVMLKNWKKRLTSDVKVKAGMEEVHMDTREMCHCSKHSRDEL